jgi:hypothetical protein
VKSLANADSNEQLNAGVSFKILLLVWPLLWKKRADYKNAIFMQIM